LLLQASKDEVFIACLPYLCPAYALPMHAGLPTIFLVGLPTIFMVGNNDWSKQLALRTINFKP
jgi:hypothetical protein